MHHNPPRPNGAWGRGSALAAQAARGLVPLALLAGLITAGPASAVDNPPLSPRAQTLQQWKDGGPAVKSAAGTALAGTDSQIRAYLEQGHKIAEELDLREAALTLVTDAGPGVSEAATKALDGTPQDLAAFMKDGWKAPLAQDQQVEAARVTEAGGSGVREAGDAAMRGSTESIRSFLSAGQYRKRDDDARVRVSQIETTGGPATKRAAAAAFKGSIEDVRDFLTYGQYIARAQDQEYATITGLAKQTAEAGAAAEKAKNSAVEQAEKAKDAARLAKAESAKAAEETKAAQNDSNRAKDAARRAAESASRAAAAAKAAIASARAANAAAQTAAIAAHNASTAALYASQAASNAWSAAASGKVNEKAASDALQAADLAEKIADSADALQKTLAASNTALQAALDSIGNMDSAAASAAESGTWAQKAGVNSAEAEAAAASARRHAAEAKRSAGIAQTHAAAAATQAREAAAAARSAAAHARKAAEAARKAADYANDAQKAANQAKINAEEAMKAAEAADAAVKKAQAVQTAARATEAEEITARTKTQVNLARDTKAKYDAAKTEVNRLQQEAVKLDTDFGTLAQQAAQPGTGDTQIAATGRKMALTAMQTRGPWAQTAAEAALRGDDAAVGEYVRTGWKKAGEQDERELDNQLAQDGPYEDVRTAAAAALKGNPAQVHAFLTAGQYKAAAPDNRIAVSKTAEAGGTGVKEAAKAALDNPDPKALTAFLLTGQHQARIEDDRVTAARLAEGGSPEVKAAAETALASPDTELRTFVESGQHRAKRRDQLNAAHVEQIQGIIADASKVTAKAFQDAYQAARSAADAQGYSDQAKGHARTADSYADKAAGYANNAKTSADNAAKSANAAAASAASARDAEGRAARSAQQASDSALDAKASAMAAAGYAASAYQAADEARQSALNAGMSATEARTKFEATIDRFMYDQYVKAEQERMRAEAAKKRQGLIDTGLTILKFFTLGPQAAGLSLNTQLDLTHMGLDILGLIPGYGEIADGANCGLYALEGVVDYFVPTGREGMWLDAGLSCLSAIPIGGWATAPVKWAKWGEKYGPKLRKVYDDLGSLFKKIPDCPRAGRNSFPAGTRVLMGDGSTKPIEKVSVGDLVKATDPESGTTGPRRVEATIHTPDDREFTDIRLGTEPTAQTLTSTDHHPYWVESRKRWVDAVDLRAGDALRTPVGTAVQIGKVSHWKGLQAAYNLTVNDLHTYYVLAGETPVLVHNTNEMPSCPVVFADIGNFDFVSPGGLIYEVDRKSGGHKIDHVLRHMTPMPGRETHTVFEELNPNKVLDLVDDAWIYRGRGVQVDKMAWVVPMGKTVGTQGEQYIRIAVDPSTNRILTAYPYPTPGVAWTP
ncbi:polymorphic toxin-type HINT domain-containing protein [Streptomyces nojiriensis]|uniref:polymorphic toxin-type HINT domain-containing protein n=1 Tax=Streptomyces nojiriensis TaxID=66374 RepID=UPI00364C917B